MLIRFARLCPLTLALLMAASTLTGEPPAGAPSANPVQFAAETTARMLTAMRDGERGLFLQDASSEMREVMTEEAFQEARRKLLPILSQPANLDFLGSLRKSGGTVFLYRLRPESGAYDSLVSTAIEDRQVVGFFVN